MTHEEEKLIREAEKRDYLRSKIRQSKRWQSEVDAKILVNESKRINDRRNKEKASILKVAGRDESMETMIGLLHKDKSIKKFTL